MQFLAIDVGSSFLKGAVLDLDTLALRDIQRAPFPQPLAGLPIGRFEVEPTSIVTAARGLLERLLAQAPQCAGIVTSTQMGGLLLVDERLRPVSNYISWRDQRASMGLAIGGTPSFQRFLDSVGADDARRLGADLKPGYVTSLLHWLAEHEQLPSIVSYPLSIGDYVLAALCEVVPVVHATSACGGVDVQRRDWAHATWDRLGLGRLRWPRMVELSEPVGVWRVAGQEIPCFPALGDHACALAGVLLQGGELSLNISTGSQVSQLTTSFESGDYQTRPYLDRRFLNTITHIPAGRSLNVLVDLLTELARLQGVSLSDPWPFVARAAEAAEETELDVDLSFFAGPLGDHGHVRGITTENLRVGTLFRAAFRAMARNYQRLAERIAPRGNWSRLVFSGGLAQNLEMLRAMVREVMPGECRVSPVTEDTLRGLLVSSLVAAGRATTVEEATRQLQQADEAT